MIIIPSSLRRGREKGLKFFISNERCVSFQSMEEIEERTEMKGEGTLGQIHATTR